MPHRFTQLAFVVRDLEKTVVHWVGATGAGPFYRVHSEILEQPLYRGQPARDRFAAAMGFLGDTLMEFIMPLNCEPSIHQEMLQSRGEGLQHIYPRLGPITAAEYDAQYAEYIAAGYAPGLTAMIPGIGRNAFFDATADLGCFIELLEINPATYAMIERMQATHCAWDRQNPMREFLDLATDKSRATGYSAGKRVRNGNAI